MLQALALESKWWFARWRARTFDNSAAIRNITNILFLWALLSIAIRIVRSDIWHVLNQVFHQITSQMFDIHKQFPTDCRIITESPHKWRKTRYSSMKLYFLIPFQSKKERSGNWKSHWYWYIVRHLFERWNNPWHCSDDYLYDIHHFPWNNYMKLQFGCMRFHNVAKLATTLHSRYIAVIFPRMTHERHPIAHHGVSFVNANLTEVFHCNCCAVHNRKIYNRDISRVCSIYK